MAIERYYTIGAVTPDLGSLKALDERLEDLNVSGESLLVLSRGRDERVIGVSLPEARTRKVESGLSRMQRFEFASMFLGVTATAVLMGAIHLWTGLTVELLLIIGSVIGLVLYYRQPKLQKQLLHMGLPEKLAEQWEESFQSGFALALVTVRSGSFGEVQDAVLDDESLETPLAVGRRPIL